MSRFLINIFFVSFLITPSAHAFYYCAGKITGLVTRSTAEDSQVWIEGMQGVAQLGLGGAEQSEMHKRQFAMLLTAWALGRKINLEFPDSGSCTDSQSIRLVRFVHLTD
ncbi:MAG: hypothetical protein K2Q15_03515 [Burkholderiales bacterium]|nr:hypothetical protein [Burkholderiales bacterium]